MPEDLKYPGPLEVAFLYHENFTEYFIYDAESGKRIAVTTPLARPIDELEVWEEREKRKARYLSMARIIVEHNYIKIIDLAANDRLTGKQFEFKIGVRTKNHINVLLCQA
jgi:hypothetical protein